MTHLKKLAMCFIVCIFLISGCANSEEKEIYQSENLSTSKYLDTFGFSLLPGEQAAYSSNLSFAETTEFAYQVTWSRSGLLIKIGLVDEEGHEYLNEEVGGSSCGTIEGIPAGTYQFIVRSCQENSVSLSESKLVLGAAAFLYEEEGFD